MRYSGRKIQQLMRVVLRCCTERKQAVIIYSSENSLRHALNQAREVCAPLGKFANFNPTGETVKFANGSSLTLRATSSVESRSLTGIKFDIVEEDHTVWERNVSMVYRDELARLEHLRDRDVPRGMV